MGGYFGAISHRDVGLDVFFGTDYHSHLGTRRGGMVVYGPETGFVREIHDIENTPFRTKFESALHEFKGHIGMGCISDTDPQPLLVRSHLGLYAICTVGIINNIDELIDTYFSDHGHQFMAQSSGKVNVSELVAALINMKENLVEGILYAQEMIKGSITILLMTPDGILAARDRLGRLPVLVGKHPDGSLCVSFESFAYHKLGYQDSHELGPREIVKVTADGWQTLSQPGKDMKICAFLWSYYGYPNSNYEGVNVEVMRYRNGERMAQDDKERGVAQDLDYVAGVPDSGLPPAEGYSHESGIPFGEGLIKNRYVGRTFIEPTQELRAMGVRMKLNPLRDNIEGKRLVVIDDSIVRGTTMVQLVKMLRNAGAKEIHIRINSPEVIWPCFYGIDTDVQSQLISANKTVDEICEYIGADSLAFLSVEGLLKVMPKGGYCDACFTGRYPVAIPESFGRDKFMEGFKPRNLDKPLHFDDDAVIEKYDDRSWEEEHGEA